MFLYKTFEYKGYADSSIKSFVFRKLATCAGYDKLGEVLKFKVNKGLSNVTRMPLELTGYINAF